MAIDNGWIKIYRQLTDSEIWKIQPFSKGQAWIDLLMLTNYSPGVVTVKNGEMIRVERGECGWSALALSKRWGWSRGKVNRFFDYLSVSEMVQQKKFGNYIMLTICNYNQFQDDTTNDTTNSTTNGQQTDNKQYTNKNNKKEKKEGEGESHAPACTQGGYPETVDEILEIATYPQCAIANITRDQAEMYLLTRANVDWIDAVGRKITPSRVPGDLRRWMIREQQMQKDAKPTAEDDAQQMRNRYDNIRRQGK